MKLTKYMLAVQAKKKHRIGPPNESDDRQFCLQEDFYYCIIYPLSHPLTHTYDMFFSITVASAWLRHTSPREFLHFRNM